MQDNTTDVDAKVSGFGPTATVEFSKEELMDIKSALHNKAWELSDNGHEAYAEDMDERVDKIRHVLNELETEGGE